MSKNIRADDHQFLLENVIYLEDDYRPYGNADGAGTGRDCSSGCKWYLVLQGHLSSDWGVCVNPKSHRCGLLTFEHQGCNKFEREKKFQKGGK